MLSVNSILASEREREQCQQIGDRSTRTQSIRRRTAVLSSLLKYRSVEWWMKSVSDKQI